MSDRVFKVRCISAPWTNWTPMWVLLHQGVYEYDIDGNVYTFHTLQQVEDFVRNNRTGWWLELPPEVLMGRRSYE